MSRQDATELSAGLLGSYSAVWSQLQDQQTALINARNPKRAARTLANDAHDAMDALDTETNDWLTTQWSGVYGWGAIDADPSWEWDSSAVSSATDSANVLYTQLYGATSGVVRTTSRLARTSYLNALNADGFARLLAKHGAAAVVYRNGARHGLADYADMAIRTATTIAYNEASVKAGLAAGAKWFLLSDGQGCCVDSHSGGEVANGIIADANFAFAHPLAHPRCQRTYQPMYDIEADPSEATDGVLQRSPDSPALAQPEPTRGQQQLLARLSAREASLSARHSGGNVGQ